jgi:hypothetical protein
VPFVAPTDASKCILLVPSRQLAASHIVEEALADYHDRRRSQRRSAR